MVIAIPLKVLLLVGIILWIEVAQWMWERVGGGSSFIVESLTSWRCQLGLERALRGKHELGLGMAGRSMRLGKAGR